MFSNVVIFFPTFKECKKTLNVSNYEKYSYFDVVRYRSIYIVITGATKTCAAMQSALFFAEYKPKYPLLTGICGAYQQSNVNTSLNIGEVVSIEHDYFVDEANYNGIQLTTLHEKGFIIADNNRASFTIDNDYKIVNSNTISLIPQMNSISEQYMQKTGASVENMEGASFGAVANKFNVKPYQIRAISNYCGDIDKQCWDIDKACKSLKQAIDLFIDKHI